EDRAIACMPTKHEQNLTGDRKFRALADVLLCFDVQDLTAAVGGYGSQRSGIMGAGSSADGAKVIDISMNDYFGNSWTRFGGPVAPLDLQVTADPKLALLELLKVVEARLADDKDRFAERRESVAARKRALVEAQQSALKARWNDTPMPLSRVTHEVYSSLTEKDWSLVVRNHRTWAEGYWH